MANLFQTQWAICPNGFDFWTEPCIPKITESLTSGVSQPPTIEIPRSGVCLCISIVDTSPSNTGFFPVKRRISLIKAYGNHTFKYYFVTFLTIKSFRKTLEEHFVFFCLKHCGKGD